MTIEQAILSASEFRRGSRIYYLPPIDGSFRVAASQIRALNLVSALAKVHSLGAADEVAVVGGEIQGMTAAAALASLGCKVHIFHSYGQLGGDVRLSNRYVHPNVGDWPFEALSLTTRLPFLEWYAGPASDVFAMVDEQFQEFRSDVDLHFNCELNDVSAVDMSGKVTLRLSGAHAQEKRGLSAVIFADATEDEMSLPSVQNPPYWHSDSLEYDRQRSKSGVFVVAGSTEAALHDVLRLSHNDFRYGRLAIEIAAALHASEIAAAIEAGEKAAETSNEPDTVLAQCYQAAAAAIDSVAPRSLSRRLKASLVQRNTVYLLGREEAGPYSRANAPILKLLTAHAIRNGAIRYARALPQVRGDHIEFSDVSLPLSTTKVIVRYGSRKSFDSLLSDAERSDLSLRQSTLTQTGSALIDPSPIQEGSVFIQSRYRLAGRAVRQELGLSLSLRKTGFELRGPEEARANAPSHLFGVPLVFRGPVPRMESLAGIEVSPVARLGRSVRILPRTNLQPEEATYNVERLKPVLDVARRKLSRYRRSAEIEICHGIFDFFEATPISYRDIFTLERLCAALDRNKVDEALLGAVGMLAGPSFNILKARLSFAEEDNRLSEISLQDFEDARRRGSLPHPRTSLPVDDFEQFVVPYFTLGSALTGANS